MHMNCLEAIKIFDRWIDREKKGMIKKSTVPIV